ncbi:MAG: MFS transporter [Armatimonadetes bacterium]|nr:MFS transporter [Armatimonadota bacterium]
MTMRRNLLLIYLIGVLYYAAWQGVAPFIPLRIQALGATPVVLGLLMAVGALVPVIAAIPVGMLTARLGPRTITTAGCAGAAVAFWSLGWVAGVPAAAAGLALMGLSQTLILVATQTLAMGDTTHRAHVAGMYMFATSIGQVIGPAAAGVLVVLGGYGLAFSVCALFALASAGIAVAISGSARGGKVTRLGLSFQVIRRNPEVRRSLYASNLSEYTFGFWQTFFPVLLHQFHLSPALIGLLFSTRAFASMSVRPFVGHLSQMAHRNLLMGIALAGGALSLLLLPFTKALVVLAAHIAMMGASLGLLFPVALVTFSEGFPLAQLATATGVRLGLSRLAQALGPASLGVAVEAAGLGAGFVIAGAGMAMLAARFLLPKPAGAARVPSETPAP